MRRKGLAFVLGVLSIIVFFSVSPVSAVDMPALISFDSPAVTYGGDHSLGYKFGTNTSVVVTALGFYDDLNALPMAINHDVGIFDTSGTLLASATVTPAGFQVGLFRYASLSSPLLLTGGNDYYIAGVVNNDGWVYQASNIVTDSFITYEGAYYHASTSLLTFPENYASDRQYMTVNFLMQSAVPLPTTLLLFGPGLVGLAALRRRLKK